MPNLRAHLSNVTIGVKKSIVPDIGVLITDQVVVIDFAPIKLRALPRGVIYQVSGHAILGAV
jgi:hypothetical protein